MNRAFLSGAPETRPLLSGVTVLDFTTFLSGPFCTQILADLGATIIKVEAFEGDSSRMIPPHFIGEDSAYYLGNNRNKKSIAINLKQPEGLLLAKRLIGVSDVVVENFRPGVCERLGLDVAAIRRAQPDLIWSSISGFGQTGPWRDRPAYDMIVQALGGVMSLTGEEGRPAMRLGIPAGDLVAGMYATIGILAGLVARRGGGPGCELDISMLDGQLTMLSYQAVYALLSGVTPKPQAAQHDSIPTYRSFLGGDGRELVVTANTERMWRSLCATLGLPKLADDPRFANGKVRHLNRDALAPLLERAFQGKPAAAWVDALSQEGVPVALIKTVPEALDDAEDAGRGMIVTLAGSDERRVKVIGNPIKVAGYAASEPTYPPRLAEHTVACLRDLLGMDTDEIERLRQAGVLMPDAAHLSAQPEQLGIGV